MSDKKKATNEYGEFFEKTRDGKVSTTQITTHRKGYVLNGVFYPYVETSQIQDEGLFMFALKNGLYCIESMPQHKRDVIIRVSDNLKNSMSLWYKCLSSNEIGNIPICFDIMADVDGGKDALFVSAQSFFIGLSDNYLSTLITLVDFLQSNPNLTEDITMSVILTFGGIDIDKNQFAFDNFIAEIREPYALIYAPCDGCEMHGLSMRVPLKYSITQLKRKVFQYDIIIPHAIYSQPSWIDPTIVISPNETMSKDVRLITGGGLDNNNFSDNYLSFVNSVGGLSSNSLLQFDLSGIPAGDVIDNAVLTLYRSALSGSGNPVVTAYMLARDWHELQATWNSAKTGTSWSTPGAQHIPNDRFASPTAVATIDNAASGNPTSWNVTSFVEMWHSGARINNGFVLDIPATAGHYAHMHSSSGAISPRLTITHHTPTSERKQTTLSAIGGGQEWGNVM